MNERQSRQSFLGNRSDEILAKSRIAIVGLGGGGSHIAQQLAHIGVGYLTLYDSDTAEHSNLNRLVGATSEDCDRAVLKTYIAERLIKSVNPEATVLPVPKKWQDEAIHLRSCDLVFGCLDTYAARDELERTCRRFLIPYIDIGMDVTKSENRYVISGQIILSMPGQPCMRCLGFLTEDLLAQEAARYGAAGGRPQVIWPNGVLASGAVGLCMQLLTPWHDAKLPVYLEYDGNTHTLMPSNRLIYVSGKKCMHFSSSTDLGDSFWEAKDLTINRDFPNEEPLLRNEFPTATL